MARVRHLSLEEQRKLELVARFIRVRFDPGAMIEPRPRISRIMLVPPESRPDKRPPDYEFWIILTDRLFTRQRLWRSVRREIRRSVGDCRVRSEEHTSELQSLMRISYAVLCLKKKTKQKEILSKAKDHTEIHKKLQTTNMK